MIKYNELQFRSKIPLLFSIVFFSVSFFINDDFGIRYLYNYLLLSLLILGELLLQRKIRVNLMTTEYFLLVMTVAIFSSLPNANLDLETQNKTISMLLFFCCYILSFPSAKEIRASNKLLITSALIMSFYIILVKVYPDFFWVNIFPRLSQDAQNYAQLLLRVYNYGVPIGNSATFADYIIAMALFVVLGGCFSGKILHEDTHKFYIISLILFVAMVIVNRRGELLGTFLAILLIYFISKKDIIIRKIRIRRLASVVFGLFAVLITMFQFGLFDKYINSFINIFGSSTLQSIDEVATGRIVLWLRAINLFESSSSYLIGIGWNQFKANNFMLSIVGNPMNVHNDYLQWLCETGVIGFTLIFFLTIIIWVKTIKRCRYTFNIKNKVNCESKCYALISCGIQTFFVFMHLIDPVFYKLLFWPLYSYSLVMYRLSIYKEQIIS